MPRRRDAAFGHVQAPFRAKSAHFKAGRAAGEDGSRMILVVNASRRFKQNAPRVLGGRPELLDLPSIPGA